jgi:hypothetical protein
MTTLTLVARDDENKRLAGYEVISRRPGAPKEEPSENLGLTDWQGQIQIPPSQHGIRIIYVQRGTRPLIKLPLIPGLYENVTAEVPNDDTRLYAEGIISGMETEILELVMQRQIYEVQIATSMTDLKFDEADELLEKYQNLPSPQDIKNRLADEEVRLKSQTTDQREQEYITTMFSTLRQILNTKVSQSKETELRQQLQLARQNASPN